MKQGKVIPITQDDHFADYAEQLCEMQKAPHPDYTKKEPDTFWPGVLILLGCAIFWYLFWVNV